jgi:hypothetical protein
MITDCSLHERRPVVPKREIVVLPEHPMTMVEL